MAAGGDSSLLSIGAGRIYVAPLGTAEPTDNSTALPSAWIPIGYTEDGTTVSMELGNEPIEVAEEIDPVLYVLASRATTLSVQMAEVTVKSLALALGTGAGTANDDTPFEPPEPGAEVAVMLVWDSDETASVDNRRWLFRQAKANGTVEMQRNKAPNKALLPVEYNLEKPAGLAPFKVFPNASGLI